MTIFVYTLEHKKVKLNCSDNQTNSIKKGKQPEFTEYKFQDYSKGIDMTLNTGLTPVLAHSRRKAGKRETGATIMKLIIAQTKYIAGEIPETLRK